MSGRSGSWVARQARSALAGLVVGAALLAGCEPLNDPSAGMSVAEKLALIERTPRCDTSIGAVAEAFALGTKSTQVQRDQLERAVVGHTVEWDFPVYEVGYVEGRFEVTSQAIPITNGDAVPVLRVVAFITPRNEQDQALLMKVKTDDVIRVRGIVQEIRARTIAAVVPGVVVGEPEEGAAGP